jgi:hypothetical protein
VWVDQGKKERGYSGFYMPRNRTAVQHSSAFTIGPQERSGDQVRREVRVTAAFATTSYDSRANGHADRDDVSWKPSKAVGQ